MKRSKLATSAGWRRKVLMAGFGMGGALAVAAVAWACTLRVGTLIVCTVPPVASPLDLSSNCSRVTGTGGQNGLAQMPKAGSNLEVGALNFYQSAYSITFRIPGSTASCHRESAGGAGPVYRLKDVATNQNTWNGPNFTATVKSPTTAATGTALICTQDEPNVVTGNQVNVAVI